MTNSICMRS